MLWKNKVEVPLEKIPWREYLQAWLILSLDRTEQTLSIKSAVLQPIPENAGHRDQKIYLPSAVRSGTRLGVNLSFCLPLKGSGSGSV